MKNHIYRGGREACADAPTIVMLHGAGMDHTVWTLLARYHARRGYNVIAPNFPEHGRSDGPALESIEALADWLEAVLQEESIAKPYILGHSMGSLVALETAARLGDNCAGLGLFGSTAPMLVGPALLNAARDNNPSAIDMICLFGHDTPAQLGGNPVCGVNMLNSNRRLLQQSKPDVLFKDLNACNEWTTGLSRAAQIKAHTTLILGRYDKMTPLRSAQALQSALPMSEEIIIECGHMLMCEAPEASHQALIKALGNASF